MKTVHKYVLLYAIVISFAVLIGCESAEQSGATQSNRVQFGQNEHEKDFGLYTVHVNALTTDQLPPEVAKTYRIARSKSRAMLNVVIIKKVDGNKQPMTGDVSTVTRNMAGQLKNVEMREIVEQDAIYYIGDIPVDNAETLIFDIDVIPKGETSPYIMAYRQQFFTK